MKLNDKTEIHAAHQPKESKKPTAVFIHGDGQNHTVFKALTDYFFQKGHPVLCYDLPGHGLSQPYKNKIYSYDRSVSTLREILKHYKISKPLLVGNSSGGMTALKYAAEKEVYSVVAISACDISPAKNNPGIKNIIENYILESRRLYQGQKLFDYSQKGLDEKDISLAALKHTHPEAAEGSAESFKDFDISSRLGSIDKHVLMFCGSEDVFVSGECRERMRNEILNSRLIAFKGQGHHILLKIPEKILETLDRHYSFLVQK